MWIERDFDHGGATKQFSSGLENDQTKGVSMAAKFEANLCAYSPIPPWSSKQRSRCNPKLWHTKTVSLRWGQWVGSGWLCWLEGSLGAMGNKWEPSPCEKQNIHHPARSLSKTWDQVQSIAVVRYGSSFVENRIGSNDRRAFSFPASFSTKTVHLEDPARFGWEMERTWIDPKENNITPNKFVNVRWKNAPQKKHYEAFIH